VPMLYKVAPMLYKVAPMLYKVVLLVRLRAPAMPKKAPPPCQVKLTLPGHQPMLQELKELLEDTR